MVARLAHRTHARLRDEHKRWIDPEDMMQEALIGAVSAERTYREGRGSKFSTRAYTGMSWRLKHAEKKLNYGMRSSPGLVELDAGAEGDGKGPPLELVDSKAGVVPDGFRAFVCLVRAVNALGPVETARAAIEYLVVGLIFCRQSRKQTDAEQLLARAQKQTGVKYSELKTCTTDEVTRRKVLLWSSEAGIMDSGAENKYRCLECVRCGADYTLAAIRQKRFFLVPNVCWHCYKEMFQDEESCFGKQYSTKAVECRQHCPDRVQCAEFSKSKEQGMVTADVIEGTAEAVPEVEAPKKKAVAKKKGKKVAVKTAKTVAKTVAKKKAKAAVAAPEAPKKAAKLKVVEDEEDFDPAPAEIGGVWPWRGGSLLQETFKECLYIPGKSAYKGISHAALDAMFAKGSRKKGIPAGGLSKGNRDYMLKHMKKGEAGKAVVTHRWEYDGTGGRHRVLNVRYLLGKKRKKAA